MHVANMALDLIAASAISLWSKSLHVVNYVGFRNIVNAESMFSLHGLSIASRFLYILKYTCRNVNARGLLGSSENARTLRGDPTDRGTI